MTTNVIHQSDCSLLKFYDPSDFINVVYVLLSILCFCLVLLFIIHWYINSAKLVIKSTKLLDLLFSKLPLFIDKYTNQEFVVLYLKNKIQKIIDKRKINITNFLLAFIVLFFTLIFVNRTKIYLLML